jgi:hypothetical protein
MSDHLSLSQVTALTAYAAAMACTQLLFKTAARGGDGPLPARIAGFSLSRLFSVALILYAGLTVLWVWILNVIPLSRAYPFQALAAERLSMPLVIRIVPILCGLFFVAR